ncbi:unnamed protein product [Caenorhabditis brenneri]
MALTPNRIKSINAIIDAECPICQSRMIVPTAVPACGHKYCFTCLKGVCMNGMGCPMCRGPIDPTIFSLPTQSLDLKMDVPDSPVPILNQKKQDSDDNTTRKPAPIPLDFNVLNEKEKHYWLYQGKNQGWWRFDPRNEREIEEAFTKKDHQCFCEVIVCGKPYIVDFHKSLQHPKDNPTQVRSVKRVTAKDFDTLGVKGLAGVFVPPK